MIIFEVSVLDLMGKHCDLFSELNSVIHFCSLTSMILTWSIQSIANMIP